VAAQARGRDGVEAGDGVKEGVFGGDRYCTVVFTSG
jgi:hypothetical protein